MNKKILHFALCSLLFALSANSFAAAEEVVCDTDPSFAENTCEVCYKEDFAHTTTSEGWSANISELTIPWKHAGGALDEIIYDNEQKFPELKTTLTFTAKPEKSELLWKNDDTLVWTPFADHKEFFIKNGTSVGLYTLQDNAGITIEGYKSSDTALFVTPLVVRDFDSKTNEDSAPKTRNICVLATFTKKQETTTLPVIEEAVEETPTTETALENAPVEVPATDPATPEISVLNAAYAETVSGEVVVTGDQTTTKTGPELWIMILLAFAFASGWHAWKKQKS